MPARKLRIAVVALAMLGLEREVHAEALTLAWDHSRSTNVAGYLVSYGTQSGKYTANVKAGYVTSVTISGLTEGATYYFIIQSYDAQGTPGLPSLELEGRVPGQSLAISCPSPVLTSLDGKPIPVTLTPTVTGGVTPIATTCSPASGSLFSVGTSSFTCRAVDAAQQEASCSSTVVVAAAPQPVPAPQPTPGPPATEPKPAPAPTPTPAPPTPQPPAPDSGSRPSPAPTPDPGPGRALPPTLECPAIAPVMESGDTGGAAVKFDHPVFSDGSTPVTVSCAPRSGSRFRVGTTDVSCRALNAARQLATCTTSVTVNPRPKSEN